MGTVVCFNMVKLDNLLLSASIIIAAVLITYGLIHINYSETKCFNKVYKVVYEKEFKRYGNKTTAENNAALMARQSCK